MKRKLAGVVSVLAIALITMVGTASAHHGTTGYDSTRVVTVTGTVTKYVWSNPHIIVFMDAPDEKGQGRALGD